MRRLRNHLTYANVVATLALVIAVAGGTAYAANTIFSSDIVDGEVKAPDIAAGAVATSEIGKDQVQSVDVRDDTLANGGLRGADIALGAVTASDIGNGTVTSADIANSTITGDDVLKQSGIDTCPATNKLGDVCVRAENFPRTWTNAMAHCANLDLRLPTLGEALYMAQRHDIPNVDQTELFWTDQLYDATPTTIEVDAWVVDDNPDLLERGDALVETEELETVCVTTPTN